MPLFDGFKTTKISNKDTVSFSHLPTSGIICNIV